MVGKKKTEAKEKKSVARANAKDVKSKMVKTTINKLVVKKKAPKKDCEDRNCPVHGLLKTHGRVFVGRVVSDKMQGTINVEWERQLLVPKYERYLKRRTRVKAHNPPCFNAKKGDFVQIAECRPISKTVSFVVIEVRNESA